jgi:two-component system, chemotaxis family, CheB/CheR fusion protein
VNDATSSDRRAPSLVVGIGASAGGLAAFKSFLAHTPADTGMAFVLVQHLDPHHKSLLVELLGAQSPIPVVEARDGLMVKANCVFVIPPDATLTIVDGTLRLASPAPDRAHRRPIDTFFASLAADFDERAVAIVLAGVGSDGTAGIKSIKEHGGLTMAQAEFDAIALQGMPSSAAATGQVDQVVPVEIMAAKLADYHKHLIEVAGKKDGNGQRKDVQEHLASVTSLLHARSEHDFSGYKEATLIRRLQRRMQVLNMDTAADYVERLRVDRSEIEALFQELLIGVTQFFRDPEAFEALMAIAIVPIVSAKSEKEPIRIWVPGCSTGEEVYSIAILLREAMQTSGRNRDVKIFGTDIDANAVAAARAGRYRMAASGMSRARFEQWFTRDGDDYCPVPEIRDMCVFSTHSLVKDPPFSRLDLISCRNVLIYLGEELQDRLMRTFHYGLSPGGYLFLGTAESVTRNSRLFTALDKKHRILQCRDTGANLPAFQPRRVPAPESPPPPAVQRRHPTDDWIEKAVGRVMQHYAPAYFVIDHNHEITRFSGAETGPYLEPSQGAANLNLFSIMHKTLRPAVRAAVNQALADCQRVVNENLSIRIDGEVRALTLIVEPIGGPNETKPGGSCVVAFRDTSPLTADGSVEAVTTSSDTSVQALERELRGIKAQLEAATDELQTRIEDMKSTTEEFQAVNEELQSANEELETSKEEMQSINEELQTINGELSSKNELLTRLNSDVQNLLESTQIATVFLDQQLRIKHFTPALTELFPVRDSDRGRPMNHIVSALDYTEILADAEKVQREGVVIERDLALKGGARSFVMHIRPYRTVKNDIDGVVITFVDITDRKRAEHSMAHFQAIVNASDDAIISKDLRGIIQSWNAGAHRIFGYTAEEAVGQPAALLIPEDHADEEPDILQRIGRGETVERYDTVRQHKDRRRLPISLTVSPIRDAAGNVTGAAKIARDITKRKRVEDALSESETRLRRNAETFSRLVEQAPFGIYIVDSEFRLQQVNAGAQAVFGNVRPLIGHDLADAMRIVWPEPLASAIIDIFRHTLTTGEPYVARSLTEHRHDVDAVESYEWQIHRIVLPSGQFGIVCYFYDATRLRQVEHALRDSEAIRSLSQQAAGAGSWTWDTATGVVTWSAECYTLFGIDPQTPLLYESWRNAMHPDDREQADAAARQATERRETLSIEYRIVHPQRGERWLTSIGRPPADPENRSGYMTGISLDITQRKEAEHQQALLNRELQHRTKNLLAVVKVIAERSLPDGRHAADARPVLVARLHALANTNDLLAKADWHGASIRDVIDRTISMFAGRSTLDGENIVLSPSAAQGFALVLHELCTNAIKHGAYSTPDGRVMINWSIDTSGEEPTLVFRWSERGGPPVVRPAATSFGTTLLQHAIGGASPRTDYAPGGLRYSFTAPLTAVAAVAWLRKFGHTGRRAGSD